jgi:hypothetical protein
MEIAEKIKKLIAVFKAANDDLIGNVARQIFNLKWQPGLSARNQAHKILDELALTNQIIKGKGFYAVKEYQGSYNPHDRAIANCIGDLIKLNCPISIYREKSLTGGVRPDILGLIGHKGRALAFIIEICISEEYAYLEKKAIFYKHHNPLEEVFGIPIPHFTLVAHGKTHPGFMTFEDFLKQIKETL